MWISALLLLSVPLVVNELANDLAMGYSETRQKLLKEEWPPVLPMSIIYVVMICYNSVQTQRELIEISKKCESDKELKLLSSCSSDISKVFASNPEDKTMHGTKLTRRILIEGAAGIGKTLLAEEIVFSWVNGNVLKEFKLVFLVSLGDPRVHKVETIKDLLQMFTSIDVPYDLENYMLRVDGENFAFIFDGFNEYPVSHQKNSLIMQIIKGEVFQQSTVVVTSRPTAAAFLHLAFDRKIEVLGFSSEARDKYIKQSLCDTSEKKLELDHYLKDHPTINDLCFAPKYLSIILYLFQKNSLPETIKDMNEFFVLHTICENNNNYLTTSVNSKTLEELPCEIYKIVLKLSNLAFEGLQNNKVVFSCDEIEKMCPEFNITNNGFGLMHTVQYYNQKGTENRVYFRFLCLTIQEYLAALFVSTLSIQKQTLLIREKFWDDAYYFMWMMYVGIVGISALIPLVSTCGKVCMLNSNSNDYLVGSLLRCNINEDNRKCLYLIWCYLEAKSNSRPECASLVFCEGKVNLNNISLFTHSISSLLVFMCAILQWRSFELRNCNLRINNVLEYAIRYKEALSNLEYIDLSGNDISPWGVYCFIIRQCSGNSLAVCGDYGMQEHVNEIKSSLQANENLKSLTFCSIGIIGLESIKEILVDNATLTDVNLSWEKISSDSIKHRDIFTIIHRNYAPDTLHTRSSGRKINVNIVCEGTLGSMLNTIDLCDKNIDDVAVAVLAFGLFNNTTVERLYLSQNNISDTGALTISNCLKKNNLLKELDISQNKITVNGMNSLIEHKSTLEYVDFSENDSPPWDVYCVLIRNCHVDSLVLCGDQGMKGHINEIKDSLEGNVGLTSLTLCKIKRAGVESIKEILVNNKTINEVNLLWKKLTSEELRLLQTKYNVCTKSYKRAITVNILENNHRELSRTIDVSNRNISEDEMALLAFGLSNNVRVQELDMSNNQISDYGIVAIDAYLKKNNTLLRLDLSFNKITSSGMNYFLKSVSNPLHLEYVDLSGNDFSPWGAYCIIIRNCYCIHLTLCGDDGMKKFVKEITDSLEVNSKIESLTLCGIGSIGVESIAQVISENLILLELNLSYKKISCKKGNGKQNILLCTKFPQKASQLDAFSTINVHVLHDGLKLPTEINWPNKNLNDDLIALLAFGLHNNIMVKQLDVSQNQISDDGARAIANCLKSNNLLEKLNVSQNRITSVGMKYLQECIEDTVKLKDINVSGNCSSPWGVYCALIRHCFVNSLTIFGDDGINNHVQEVAECLQANKCLDTLTLHNVGHVTIDSIGKVLAFNTSLNRLNLLLLKNEDVYSPASETPEIKIHRKFNRDNGKSMGDAVIDVHIECSNLYKYTTSTVVTTIAVALCSNPLVEKFNIVYKNTSGACDRGTPSPWSNYCEIIKHCSSSCLSLCGDDRIKDHIKEVVHHLNVNRRLKSLTLYNIGKNGIESIKEILANNATLNEVHVNVSWKVIINDDTKQPQHTKFTPRCTVFPAGLIVSNKSSREGNIKVLYNDDDYHTGPHIDMSNMQIINDIAAVIAFGLCKNTTVTKLILSHNQISKIGAIAISDSLRSNSVLQELNLSDCRIEKEGAMHIVESLQINTTLSKLDLSRNRISDDSEITINSFILFRKALVISINKILLPIASYKRFTHINLSNKTIGDIGAQFISLFLLCNPEAAVAEAALTFSQTGISDDGAVAIGHWLEKKHVEIKSLDLSQNSITISGMLNWVSMVNITALEYVDLSDNQSSPWGAYCVIIRQCCVHSLTLFGDDGMKDHVKEITCSLAANKRVNSLILCKIGKTGVESIKQVLVNNTTLSDISLSHRKFDNEEARNNRKVYLHTKWSVYTADDTVTRMVDVNILDDICTIETINLSNKESVSDDLIALLTFGLYNNTTVQQLYISHTTLSEYGVKAIDNCLRNNSTLKVLDLSSSGISCTGMNYLLDSAQIQFNFEYVDLSENDGSPWIAYCVIIRNCLQRNLTLFGDYGMVEHVKEIADNLNANVRLKSLVLCGIGRHGIKSITDVLAQNSTLNEITLSCKKINNKEAREKAGVILYTNYFLGSDNVKKEIDINILLFCDLMQYECIPQTIDLSNAKVSDDLITVLAFGLNNNTTVQLFNVPQNITSDPWAEQNTNTLKQFNVSLNQITDDGMNYLMEHAERMSALEYIDLSGNISSPWRVYCAVIRCSCASNLTVCGNKEMENHIDTITENLEMNENLNSLTLCFTEETGMKEVNNSTSQNIKLPWMVTISKCSKRKRSNTGIKFGLLDDKTTLESEHVFSIKANFIQNICLHKTLMIAFVNVLTGLCDNATVQTLSVSYYSKSVDLSPWIMYRRIIKNCHVSNLTLCGDTGIEDHIEDIVNRLEANARIESLTLYDIGRTGVKSIKDVLADNTTSNLSWTTKYMNDDDDDGVMEKNILIHTNFPLYNRMADDSTRMVNINILYDGDSQSLSEIDLCDKMIDINDDI